MSDMKKGKIFVIAGPSGVGKGTILAKYLQEHKDIKLSVSATTRKPREGEINGVNYFFVEKNEFEKLIAKGELIEWAEFAGNYYGTFLKTVNDSLNKGENIALEIDVQGALQIKEKIKEAILIFILPPSFEELKTRLINRNTETPEALKKRLATAKKELEQRNKFNHEVVNDDLNQTLKQFEEIIEGYLK